MTFNMLAVIYEEMKELRQKRKMKTMDNRYPKSFLKRKKSLELKYLTERCK